MSLSTLPRLLRALTAEPLVIDRRTLDAFLSVLRRRGEGLSFSGTELHAELDIASPRPGRATGADGSIQVIPIVGAIANRAHSMGVGATETGRRIDAAVADPRVDGIVLDMDTPGGTVTGVPELAAKVYAARRVKPVVSIANGMMASAGYWIGSAANEVMVSPSGEGAGSIGVIWIHEDLSAALEAEGIKITEVAAGKYKTEGAPWKPLDEEAAAWMKGRVQAVYDWFTRDVARFRGASVDAVRSGFGQARVLPGRSAIDAGLADRVGTLEDAIARAAELAGERKSRKAGAQAAEIRRARLRAV